MATEPAEAPPADADVVDATAVEDPAPEVSTELAVRPGGTGAAIIRAEQPEQIIEKATAIANALKDLIEAQGLSVNVGGKRKHVEVGGWQALGAMLGALGGQALHAETVWSRVVTDPQTGEPVRTPYHVREVRKNKRDNTETISEYDVDGFSYEARVAIVTADGTVVGVAEAMCSRSELTWGRRPDPAIKSMAETRAESRAYRRAVGWIVNIAGYNPTPAEEMTAEPAELPEWAEGIPAEKVEQLRRGVMYVLGEGQGAHVQGVIDAIVKDAGGELLPRIASRAALHVAAAVKAIREPAPAAEPASASPAAEPAAQTSGDIPLDTALAQQQPPDDGPPIDPNAPASGSVPMPDLSAITDPAKKAAALRQAGCICKNPLAEDSKTFDGACPLAGHGVPF